MAKAKLTPADNKFIAKFLRLTEADFKPEQKFFRMNRFTGEKFEVDCIEAAALDFIFNLEGTIHNRNEAAMKRISPELKLTNAVQNFDRARMLVLKLNPKAYMGILD